MVDRDGDLRVKEALHAKCPCEQGGLGEILMFCEGEEGAMEVPVRNEDDDVSARMRPEREDACDGRFRSCEHAVVTSAEAAFDASAVSEGEEGNDKVVGVGNGIDVDRVVVHGGLVGKVNDGCGTCRRGRDVEGGEDAGMGPCETCGNAEDREGGG